MSIRVNSTLFCGTRLATRLLTWFQTCSSGLSCGDYGGRKNNFSLPSCAATKSLTSFDLCAGVSIHDEEDGARYRVVSATILRFCRAICSAGQGGVVAQSLPWSRLSRFHRLVRDMPNLRAASALFPPASASARAMVSISSSPWCWPR